MPDASRAALLGEAHAVPVHELLEVAQAGGGGGDGVGADGGRVDGVVRVCKAELALLLHRGRDAHEIGRDGVARGHRGDAHALQLHGGAGAISASDHAMEASVQGQQSNQYTTEGLHRERDGAWVRVP